MNKLHITLLSNGPLSKAESAVLVYLCKGYSRQEIADAPPKRSVSTIHRQVESIAYKLEAHCQAEIVSTAVAMDLVKIEIDRNHHLVSNLIIVLLIMLNVIGGNMDMRRGPKTPREIRTAKVGSRTRRDSDNDSDDAAVFTVFTLENDRNKQFYLEDV